MIGKSLGPYTIVEQLGKGGMGEVWLAEDTRLGRKVAVKVLPGQFAADADRLARFEQEAKAAAALNHPNIAAIHDVGVADLDGVATHYMVQEYLQGETLHDAVARGPLPLDRALKLAVEIAEALKTAHRAGIVHRDLKPDNVFVSTDGHAKVLDFGLAKLTEMALPSGLSASMSPTMTMAGQIMGTAGYMAPEQVQGEEVDERADLFALGCVLYEMVAGRQAFGGDNVHESLSRVLTGHPTPLDDAPRHLRWVLDKLLAKDREERYQTAADVVVDLRRPPPGDEAVAPSARAVPAAPRRSPVVLGAIALATLLVGVVGAWTLKPVPTPAATPDVSFEIALDPGMGFSSTYNRVATISPDARTVAFTANDDLWLRRLDSPRPVLLDNTAGCRSPAFSPDGRQVAFWAGGQLRRIAISGGVPVIVGPYRDRPLGLHWADDGFIYIGRADKGIWRIAESGGEAEQILSVEPGESAHGPELLPGGKWMLFTLGRGVRAWHDAAIVAQSLADGERRVLVPRGREVRYVRPGYLIYVQDGALFAAPFDARQAQVTGSAVAMVDEVVTSFYDETGAASFDVSDGGVLAYVPPDGMSQETRLVWMDGRGGEDPLPIPPRRFATFRLSPDGRSIAAHVDDIDGTHIWVFAVDRAGGQRLTTTGRNTFPVWSHDGTFVYFASDRDGDIDIWRRRVDQSSPAEQVLDAGGAQLPTSASHDGAWLLYSRMAPSNSDIGRVSLDGDARNEMLIESPSDELDAHFSADGRFLVFQSDETGRWDIHVFEIASGRRWTVSPDTGFTPVWSRDGTSILYIGSSATIMRIAVKTHPEFSASEPEIALAANLRLQGQYESSADGQRVLVGAIGAADDRGQPLSKVIVVMNWTDRIVDRMKH